MKRILSFLFIVICFTATAQTPEKISYYYQGKKISFPVNYERLVIQLAPGESPVNHRSQIAAMLQLADTALKQMANKRMLSVRMPVGTAIARVQDKISNLAKQAFIGTVHPTFKSPSGKDMGYGDELVVKLKAGTSITGLQDFVKKSNGSIVKKYAFADGIYIISAGPANNYDAAETANRFFESGLFEYAEPDLTLFDGLMAAPNDPLYNYQWAHNNTGSSNQYSGTAGVDMKVQQAWNITRGHGIRIAVIDQGVDLVHPDLQANLLQGFDAISGTANAGDGKPLSPNNGHGTSCSGIIAAVANNNIGITGVAPESKIIPINVVDASGFFTSYTGLASAFDYAWQQGADVISNSWGGGSPSQLLDDAITRAVTQGRRGSGCVVLFSSGNDNSVLSYPSSNANVIAVGGANMFGQRKSPASGDGEYWWGANYGTGLDVVAPCVKVPATDITGTGGYNTSSGTDGDYFLTFNGTSSAAPNAAGVVALILSVDNNMTLARARSILESSCTKLPAYAYALNADQPNGSWNAETGYGLVDAYSAVQLASGVSNQPSVFRSKKTGAYSDLSIWEVKSGTGFVNATSLPASGDDSIIIRSGHTVTIDQSVQMDQLLVETGAVLRLSQNLFLSNGPGDDLVVNGALELVSGGVLAVGAGTTRLNGNLTAIVAGIAISGQIDVAGNTPQTLTLGGNEHPNLSLNITNPAVTIQLASGNVTMDQLVMNNSNGKVNLNGAFTLLVRVLTLTSGRILVAGNSLLNIKAPTVGAIVGGSETSFIEGPLRRNSGAQGADVLFFPIGKDVYRPVWLNVTAPAGGYSSYQAQVFNSAPASRTLPASLNAVSNARYVRIINTGVQAPTAAAVTLSYGPDEGLPSSSSLLRIAKDDGAGKWIDLGGTGSGNTFGNILSTVNFSSFGDFVLATAASSIPGCTSNTTPANGATIASSSTALLGWNSVINATAYDVFIWSGATAPTQPTTNVATTSYTATGLTGATTYNWYVRPKNSSGYISSACIDNKTSFTTATGAAIPACAVNISPANASTLLTQTSVRLKWSAVSGATSYDIYLAAGNGVPTVLWANVTDLTYYLTSLPAGTLYSWYIAPRNADGVNTTCGAINKTTFTTAVATGGNNLSPKANAGSDKSTTLPVTSLTLDGSDSYDPDGRIAQYYWYQVQGPVAAAINNSFSVNPVVTGLTTAGKYVFGLQVKDENGVAAYSSMTVTVNPAATAIPTCTTNTSPVNGSTIGTTTTVRLTWGLVVNAASYDVYLWTGATAPLTPTASNVIGTWYDATGLSASALYNWYVVPRNANGAATGCSANTTTFTTAAAAGLPACVDNVFPVNGTVLLTQTTARLKWSASPGATSYDVYLQTGTGVPTVSFANVTDLTYYMTFLTPGITFSWYIAPRNANGANTACGSTNRTTFTTAAATSGANLVPVSNAGSDIPVILPASTAQLDGTGSYDPDGRIIQYYWYQAQGPVASSISNAFSVNPTVTGLTTAGNYIFVLQVKDNNGVLSYSQVKVTVSPSAIPGAPTCTTNTSPVNGSIIATPTTVTLSWNAVSGATAYDVYFWTGGTTPTTPITSVGNLSYSLINLNASTTYNWYVVPRNAAGSATGCVNNKTTFTTASAASTPGTGLRGDYYSGTGILSGPIILTRVDPTINMLLTYSTVLSPAPGIVPNDNFSIRWTGQVKADFTETYTFYTLADDGIRLWVNGVQLVDNFVQQGPTERSSTISLVAGQKYDIKIEYFEWTGESTAKLSWSSASTPKAVVPQANLYLPASGASVATTAPISNAGLPLLVSTVNPNPVKRGQDARLQINADKAGSAVVNIQSGNGHTVSSRKINVVPGVNTTSIATSALAQGLYIISIGGIDKPVNIKLLVIN